MRKLTIISGNGKMLVRLNKAFDKLSDDEVIKDLQKSWERMTPLKLEIQSIGNAVDAKVKRIIVSTDADILQAVRSQSYKTTVNVPLFNRKYA